MGDRHAFRAKWHDYNEGIYFVTICTHNKVHTFGKIHRNEMYLSELGKITNDCILDLVNHHDVEVHNSVVMPNHVHLVVGARPAAPVETEHTSPNPSNINLGCLKPPIYGTPTDNFHHNSQLAVIVGSFKAAVTRKYRKMLREANTAEWTRQDFTRAWQATPLPAPSSPIWQRLYHEHIILSQTAYDNIMQYVDENVARWNNDVFNI